MHRLITFARHDLTPPRPIPIRRRPTIDGLEPRGYFAGLSVSSHVADPAALPMSFNPTGAGVAILAA